MARGATEAERNREHQDDGAVPKGEHENDPAHAGPLPEPPERLGAGPIVTFIDDALQLTFGWALNALAARMYYGVGFSVVGLR